jgi:peptidoglycan/LPS O-acetylase OafA/YrhL
MAEAEAQGMPAVAEVAAVPVAKEPPPRVYFPELDGLRSWAFLAVYLFHGGVPWPLFAQVAGSRAARSFRENGWVGVQLFFILSGYLITTLLLTEEARFGRVDLRAFWVRRALRIWPLYYLAVFIGFVVMPWCDGALGTPGHREALGRHLPAFLLFLGNWSLALRGPGPNDQVGVLWSVCVEEQFYLLAPLLVAWVSPRLRVRVVLALMAASIALRWHLARDPGQHQMMVQFNTFAQLDTMLSGVLLALFLGTDPKGGRVSRWARWLQWPLYALIVWVMTRPHLAQVEPWRRTWDFVAIWACGVGLLAVAVTVRGWLQAVLSATTLVWLGKISYGLYMYHEVAFWLRPKVADQLGWFPNKEPLTAFGTLAATVALAAASYYAFERPFLRWKRSWTRLPSRPV